MTILRETRNLIEDLRILIKFMANISLLLIDLINNYFRPIMPLSLPPSLIQEIIILLELNKII